MASTIAAADRFQILHRDEHLVAIEKPAGFHVHQPEFPRRRVPESQVCLGGLRDQLRSYIFPVHRLDVATEGVLLFALKKESASSLCRQFQTGVVRKTYFALTRGWMPEKGLVDLPLELDSTGDLAESRTRFLTHGRIELDQAVGKRHSTARYSLVEAHPETGRFHQVRRHFARLSHPLVGDCAHGDSYHNRFFRETLGLPGLWLKAKTIEFQHPVTGANVMVESAWSSRWLSMFAQLGVRPQTGAGI